MKIGDLWSGFRSEFLGKRNCSAYARRRTDPAQNRGQYHCSRKEIAMQDEIPATAWKRFADKVKGLWRKPVEPDFAAMAAASLKHEKETPVAPETPGVSQR
jgi:hypothetical protein